MLVMIDNYDSFTYNIVQYLGELGSDVRVFRNDSTNIQEIDSLSPSQIVISPGPCTPNEAGISMDVIRNFAGKTPILGVCLGHQSIGQVFGGNVINAKNVMHGKLSAIHHSDAGVFKGLPTPFIATRYHSLVINQAKIPDCLEVTAWTKDENGTLDEVMGIRHKEFQVEGVQFHPESILSDHGHKILKNFLTIKTQR